MSPYRPYSWYRCSNRCCAMLTALPEGMVGEQLAFLPGLLANFEPLTLMCPCCDCVCNCTPTGRRAPIPTQVLSKSRRMSYYKLWLRCGDPECKSLTRLLVFVDSHTTNADLKAFVSTKRVLGVMCCFSHPISKAVAA